MAFLAKYRSFVADVAHVAHCTGGIGNNIETPTLARGATQPAGMPPSTTGPAGAAKGQGKDVVAAFVSDLALTFNTPADRDEAADLLASFEERAGIYEYDGGLSRPEAEKLAGADVKLSPTAIALLREVGDRHGYGRGRGGL